jgi:hypothetical protein
MRIAKTRASIAMNIRLAPELAEQILVYVPSRYPDKTAFVRAAIVSQLAVEAAQLERLG